MGTKTVVTGAQQQHSGIGDGRKRKPAFTRFELGNVVHKS
jgi:hypothetical protein